LAKKSVEYLVAVSREAEEEWKWYCTIGRQAHGTQERGEGDMRDIGA